MFTACSMTIMKAQTTWYEYDKRGNITRKYVTATPYRVSFEVNPDSISNPHLLEENELLIRIHPNPTKGLLKIDIENFNYGDHVEMSLYNVEGQTLLKSTIVDSHIDLDISDYIDGIYILVLVRNGKQSSWRIVKS